MEACNDIHHQPSKYRFQTAAVEKEKGKGKGKEKDAIELLELGVNPSEISNLRYSSISSGMYRRTQSSKAEIARNWHFRII